MTNSQRLSSGGLIDRGKPLSFRFDGKTYRGFAGDTLASALLANGVKLVGRSFKYHRPRGIFTTGAEEPNALITLRSGARREPNTKATTVELYGGLEATSQNCWPSLDFDLQAVNQLFAPLFVGGFYYKTFMWPAAFWEKVYEPLIRRAAGLGAASGLPDPDRYEHATAYCDVLIIGAGPAGLSAALAAGRAGARVILCEEDFRLGGRLLADHYQIDGETGTQWAEQAEAELTALPEVRIFRRTSVFGVYDGGVYGALERVADHLPQPPVHQPRQRVWQIVARRAITAMGALERPIVFGGNDRPGVMLASALRAYVNRFAVAPGRVALFTTTDDGWKTAEDLIRAEIPIEIVIDPRANVAEWLMKPIARAGTRILLDAVVTDTKGGRSLQAIEVLKSGSKLTFDVDTLAVSGGFNPQIGLSTHLGGRPRWSDEIGAFVPGELPSGMAVAGAAAGQYKLAECLAKGAACGAVAATDLGFSASAQPAPRVADEAIEVKPLWHVAQSRHKAFVDLQNDVTSKDVEIAHREGFRAVEHLKRYTTLGMATDQGKTSNINGHALMADLVGRAVAEVGTTRTRPPHVPIAIGALAGPHVGAHFKPTRYPAGHEWALANGASMVDAGQWHRPRWFTKPGEKDWLESVTREAKTVRAAVGVCDVSTLGKIDIQGRDAGIFLDRVYVNMFSSLAVGKARYGLMLREDGFVLDDGTTARLASDHYVMSTTTGNAAKVMQHLEFCHQVHWPELDVAMVSVTEQWTQYAVAGPKARVLLQNLLGDALDLSNEAFPYMACVEFTWANVPMRLFRLSFSGELAYEIAVPADYGEALLRELMRAGASLGVAPYGTEALGVLRIEKGHVSVGELNGQTTAADLGLGRMLSTKKDFIGRVLARRPALTDPERPTLAGFKPVDSAQRLRSGAHFVPLGITPSVENGEGYMTSVAFSPHVGSWIGLGLIKRGPARIGERVRAYDPVRGGDVEVEICSPVFVDPEGARLHV
ncbi:MAG TPA: sarcosine oxidase subunit alpha family protein [Methylovirgula sp.]|nr:sarcosine oxidase subunit alpha family protein [Methylovirgula sp.]